MLEPHLWRGLAAIHPLSMDTRFRKTKCVAERRSKGKLYVGEDRMDGTKCTIRKMCLDVTNAGKDDGFPTSVLRELSHLKSLDSPYVAKVIQAEVNDKVVQICFEHGMNLKDYVRRHSSKTEGLTLPQIKSITKQILIALMFCHSKGLMHRNLKPDNILVSDSGQVKICDFTLSRIGV